MSLSLSCQAQEEAERAWRDLFRKTQREEYSRVKRSDSRVEGGQTYWNSRWDLVCGGWVWRATIGQVPKACQPGASEDQPGCGLLPKARKEHLPSFLVPLWAQMHSKDPRKALGSRCFAVTEGILQLERDELFPPRKELREQKQVDTSPRWTHTWVLGVVLGQT